MDTYIGRRASGNGFEFAGSIDDVRIYSSALTEKEIQADFRSTLAARSITLTKAIESADGMCPAARVVADSRGVGLVVTAGLLASVAILGLVPTVSRWTLCLACLAVGVLLFPTLAATLPTGYKWFLPLLTLAGGASIALSIQPEQTPP
jgi:hypothetical protein